MVFNVNILLLLLVLLQKQQLIFASTKYVSFLTPASKCVVEDDLTAFRNASTTISASFIAGLDLASLLPPALLTCRAVVSYLQIKDKVAADAFCNSTHFNKICCKACELYSTPQKECIDTFKECPRFRVFCLTNYIFTLSKTLKLPIKNACPDTCKSCPKKFLDCASNLCKNGATCVNRMSVPPSSLIRFECQCAKGFLGPLCDIKDQCVPNPCQNGGFCERVGTKSYGCLCTSIYMGKNCTVTRKLPESADEELRVSSAAICKR